ncbi:hypothetical protein BUE80_DR003706 [Diplocarpon rosae]|nr:hypothetical protein BUE80_DR003706 [Diplocarpon rosae]
MKSHSLVITLLAGLVSSSPLESRQSRYVGVSATEYTQDGCKPVIFFFARGSTEVGNLGSVVGQPAGRALKEALGEDQVAVEGIDYAAAIRTNLLPGGADPAGVTAMRDLLVDAASKCPTSALLAGGYSQGAAVTHRAIEDLDPAVMDKIAGVVTFGDTQNTQDQGRIPNFPAEKLMIICNPGDAVCTGTLAILAPHFDYTKHVPEAVSFLTSKLTAA